VSPRKILTVGFELASSACQHESFRSKTSLLDWDVVLFKPSIDEFIDRTRQYQGKPCLDDDDSFHLKECCEHWRREIKQAIETGKTVLVYLSKLQEVYIATGERSYSGTGRSRSTTRHVTSYTNYAALPMSLSPVGATGHAMKLSSRGAENIAPYWAEFESVSKYNVVLTQADIPVCIVTRTADKPVGVLYRVTRSSGTLLLLPDIDFEPDNFTRMKGETVAWTPDATRFAARMVATVAALDQALRNSSDATPEPAWAAGEKYATAPEVALRLELLEAEKQVEIAQQRKESIQESLKSAAVFRALLFEKGRPLENGIIHALRLLGFSAAPYKENSSEFDVVFESLEGRLIGEAEGKDNKAVNVDKLRQLAMNIHEDLQRDDVTSPAKPVLFGNPYRLEPIDEREDPFTQKCCGGAATSSTALVFTPDLFMVVQYLIARVDDGYAKMCREALLSAVGRVAFPSPPALPQVAEANIVSDA
jgi:hypothetical protein